MGGVVIYGAPKNWVMSSTKAEVSRFEDPGVLSKEVIQEVLPSC